MAYITADIKIPEIRRNITTQLYFPTDLPEAVGNKVKGVITLLHGMSNIGDDWMMMTAIPRYAADNGYIIVAPNADNSFYHDMTYGDAFFTGLTEYWPGALRAIFHLPDEREKNFIAGFSMGGYGALRMAMACPERYAACGSFSGSIDVRGMLAMMNQDSSLRQYATSLMGPGLELPGEADLYHLAQSIAALPGAQQPRFFATCGRQDSEFVGIHNQNLAFAKHAKELGLDYTYLLWDGDHEFNVWDRSIAEFIGFIQGSDYPRQIAAGWNAPAQDITLTL